MLLCPVQLKMPLGEWVDVTLMETESRRRPNLLPGFCPKLQFFQGSWKFHAHFWTSLLASLFILLSHFKRWIMQPLTLRNAIYCVKNIDSACINEALLLTFILHINIIPEEHRRAIKRLKQITSPGSVCIFFQLGLLVCFGSGSTTP